MRIHQVKEAAKRISEVVVKTPLLKNENISGHHNANIWLKREDLQTVRSYKIRGAYNKIVSLNEQERQAGVICASAGNHAQGVAFACQCLEIKGTIVMPVTTPKQKVKKVRNFGKDYIDIILFGDTFDQAQEKAEALCKANNNSFIHPFNDEKIIEGQATIALEILDEFKGQIDYLLVPVGGGGLASGVSEVFKQLSPKTQIIGVEPMGAASMSVALTKGRPYQLKKIDRFVDGAAVQEVGDLTFSYCQNNIKRMETVDEGNICSTMLKLYNEDGIIVEPAGALAISALDALKREIQGKNVVCVVSGSNNDITRMEEIKERSLMYEGLKHYFIIRFPQRAGALKEFVNDVLGEHDDITFFEYAKKNSREKGSALIGIEIKEKDGLLSLKDRMNEKKVVFEYLNKREDLFNFLI